MPNYYDYFMNLLKKFDEFFIHNPYYDLLINPNSSAHLKQSDFKEKVHFHRNPGKVIEFKRIFQRTNQNDPLSHVAWAFRGKKKHFCMRCERYIVLHRWAHHCRACGVMVCDACCVKNALIKGCGNTPMRVCKPCYARRDLWDKTVPVTPTIKPRSNEIRDYYNSSSRQHAKATRFDELNEEALSKILLLDFAKLKQQNQFPRHDGITPIVATISAKDITQEEYEKSLFIFVSHKWLRPSADSNQSHPDNENHDKFKLCIHGIEKILELIPQDTKCYLWMDFSCINQEAAGEYLVKSLSTVMQLCDIVFTPVYEDLNSSVHDVVEPTVTSYTVKHCETAFKTYLSSGWCRAELALAARIPPLEQSVERLNRFTYGLRYHKEQGRRPHIVYGTREEINHTTIIFLPPLQYQFYRDYKPTKGRFFNTEDRKKVKQLMKEITYSFIEDPVGHHGDVDTNNVPDGKGDATFKNGDKYIGEWKNGKMHGSGIYTFANGDQYEGWFVSGKREGDGKMTFASGIQYKGNWKNDKRHGKNGVLLFLEGKQCIEGEWEEDQLTGSAISNYDTDVFKGEFKRDERHGAGHWWKDETGNEINLEYNLGKKVNPRRSANREEEFKRKESMLRRDLERLR